MKITTKYNMDFFLIAEKNADVNIYKKKCKIWESCWLDSRRIWSNN